MLRAQADRQAQMLRAEGEAQAIWTVFSAIHAGQPDQALLAYQYMQMLPNIAKGDANKVWVVPSELNKALEGLGSAVGSFSAAVPNQAKGEFQRAGEDRRAGGDHRAERQGGGGGGPDRAGGDRGRSGAGAHRRHEARIAPTAPAASRDRAPTGGDAG